MFYDRNKPKVLEVIHLLELYYAILLLDNKFIAFYVVFLCL